MLTAPPSGSSPRARGTRLPDRRRDDRDRFIPACAGNTHPIRRARPSASVHPRVRGEHADLHHARAAFFGSSPRARGTPRPGNSVVGVERFIPACAGNTPASWATPRSCSVHPRVRGEHCGTPPGSYPTAGSSPRARGTLDRLHPLASLDRFIPACAGNTAAYRTAYLSVPVHPRVRGEHDTVMPSHAASDGSSPRARGTPGADGGTADSNRFIPACAGNTASRPSWRSRSAVHPRVRGEHCGVGSATRPCGGSSPRARGTLWPRARPGLARRFIPACAGNTGATWQSLTARAVHPRVRGEHG